MIVRLPYFVTNLPEMGMVSSCPKGKASSIVPNCASLSWSLVLISGMRLAHEAKQNPMQK